MIHSKIILLSTVSATLLFSPAAIRAAGKTKPSQAAKTSARPSATDIANARSQGLVWTNPAARVYYKDGDLYGKTARGKFTTEDEAIKMGFRLGTAKSTAKKQPDQSGIDASIETHSSVPPKP